MNPAAEARDKVKANHPEAVVVERGRNNIKHRLADAPDGRQRFALDCSIGPLHYGPSNDQEIDTTFLPSIAPWDWEMTKAGFEARALSSLDAGQVIEYRSGSEWVRFQPMALQYSNDLDQIQQISMPEAVDAAVDDDTLTWTDGYGPGRTLSWQAQTARLAKLLTIDALTDLPLVEQYILDGGSPVLELNLIFAHSSGVTPYVNGQPWSKGQVETQGLVEFRDGEGNILWWFNLPRSWDADGNEQLGTLRFKKQGNSLYVSHRVPLSFVQSAVYPLIVDTTVDEQVGHADDDTFHRITAHYWSNSAPLVRIGNIDGDTKGYGSSARFTTVDVGQGDTIDVAYLTLTPNSNQSGATCKGKIHGDDDDTGDAARLANHTAYDAITRTDASVTWNPVPAWETDVEVDTPEMKTVVQEVVDRALWVADNAMQYIFHDDEELSSAGALRDGYDYGSDTGKAAKLHIEYTGAGVTTRRYSLPVLGVG